MKKFMLMMLLTVLMIIGNGNQAEAFDYYVENFPDNGAAVYVMIETIGHPDETNYIVRVKVVESSDNFYYYEYDFDNGDDTGQVSFINSEDMRGRFKYYNVNTHKKYPISETYPVEYKIYDYIVTHK